jgi:hypothetical protein
VKNIYKELVSMLTVPWVNFTRSGQQGGDSSTRFTTKGVDEWVTNFSSGNQVVMYAILCLDMINFKELGKVLPCGGVDMTVMPDATEHAEIVRKRKRETHQRMMAARRKR